MLNNKDFTKQQIIDVTLKAKERNEAAISRLTDSVSLSEYSSLVRESEYGAIWTDALQTALNEHEIVIIPKSEETYWIDNTIVIPSNRRIEAEGAEIRVVPEYPYIMVRNEHLHDGTFSPIDTSDRDCNISIHGGCWNEGASHRGLRHFHADESSFYGVQTCMLFNNIDGLTMTDVTFSHAESFSVQIGDIKDGVFENFFFISCYADGLHINGNCENLYIRNFDGCVGDDLVALNMYDWLGSSINYGPAKNVFCENIHSPKESSAKAMRLQPGIFSFRDGTTVDCSLTNMYFRNLSGIFEYKLYFQSPPYRLGEKPEGGGAGSADNLFFENVDVVGQRTDYPIDVPETGYFGMFLLNSNIGRISFENINYHVREDESPRTFLIAVGPMTWRRGDIEVFDPYISSTVGTMEISDVFVNGVRAESSEGLVKAFGFNDVNKDGFSSGKGVIENLYFNGEKINI